MVTGRKIDSMPKRDENGRFIKQEPEDLTGNIFNDLTVIDYAYTKHRSAYYKCKCVCGNETTVRKTRLKNGLTKSCGCRVTKVNGKHLQSDTRIYHVWEGMKQRCYNKNNSKYNIYGGKGIEVCEDWHEFEPFYNWAIENGYKKGLSIDRIDSEGDYKPSNCKWVSIAENSQKTNKEIPIIVTFPSGKIKEYRNISKFCKEQNLPHTSVNRNLKKGTEYRGFKIEYNQ